ncbi:hypothetical protein NL676_001698 [Syzygium grande]|nr:hypothetical protein NL676_001698 [Syzygium grande]
MSPSMAEQSNVHGRDSDTAVEQFTCDVPSGHRRARGYNLVLSHLHLPLSIPPPLSLSPPPPPPPLPAPSLIIVVVVAVAVIIVVRGDPPVDSC